MAVTAEKDLVGLLSGVEGKFRVEPFYEELTDSFIVYLEDKPSYGKRINYWLTLYLAIDGDDLVGCEIKGVNELSQVAKTLTHNDDKCSITVLISIATAVDQGPPEYQDRTAQLRKLTSELDCAA